MILLVPWLLGVVFLGGDSYWLFATAYIPVALSYVLIFAGLD